MEERDKLVKKTEIFQATANFETKKYIFVIPIDILREAEGKVPHNVDTIVDQLQKFLDSPEKIKYMVKLLHITDEALLKVDEYQVSLNGIVCEPSELVLWYDAEFDSQIEEKKAMKVVSERVNLHQDTHWIYNQKVELNQLEQNAIMVELPMQEKAVSFAPFFILTMIRAFINNITSFFEENLDSIYLEYFLVTFSATSDSPIPLYFTIHPNSHDHGIKDFAMNLIDNMISNINKNFQEHTVEKTSSKKDLTYAKGVVGEHNLNLLCTLGLQPRSYEILTQYLLKSQIHFLARKEKTNIFKIETIEPPSEPKAHIYCVKR